MPNAPITDRDREAAKVMVSRFIDDGPSPPMMRRVISQAIANARHEGFRAGVEAAAKWLVDAAEIADAEGLSQPEDVDKLNQLANLIRSIKETP